MQYINLWLYLSTYLVCSIPFGLLLAKIFAKSDIRQLGSKNIGATNVMRVVKQSNPKLAKILSISTFLLDFLKGMFMLFIASYMGADNNILWAIAIIAVLGHCFSIYLYFEGGKGISTFFGVFMFFNPQLTIIGMLIWLLVLKFIKISSLSALLSTLSIVLLMYFFDDTLSTHVPIFLIYFLVTYKHYENIENLIFKKESKIV
jgi:glycerol-3-phosphate acyltransferase PlsY